MGETFDAACEPCDAVCGEKNIFDSVNFFGRNPGSKTKSKIDVYGWMLTGITANEYGSSNEYSHSNPASSVYGYQNRNGMLDPSGNSYVLMLEQPSEWKVNQLWVGAKKDLDDKFGVGFRADFSYGTDSRYAQNWGDHSFDYGWGSGDYYSAIPQLYALVGTKDLNIQVGKFAGNFAYEGLAAPREFFYTHANICYGRPLVTEGVMLNWNLNKKWTVNAGWTAGVFNDFGSFDDNGFLGKLTYHWSKKTDVTYKIFYNDKTQRTVGATTDLFQTVVLTHKFNDRWFYMGELAWVDTDSAAAVHIGDAWGINQHLIYTVNKKWQVGLRGEYHYSHNSMFTLGTRQPNERGDLWEFTLAAKYLLTDKVTIRPEIRYDYADYRSGYRPFGGDESEDDQFSGGVSFIVMF